MTDRTTTLSPRQARVLNAVADGTTLTAAAHQLGVTRAWVAARLSETYRRLGVDLVPRNQRRAAAVREARRRGFIPPANQTPEG